MREATKWTVGYQTRNLFLVNLEGIGVAFLFSLLFYSLLSQPVFREIISTVLIAVYFGMIYSRANKFAVNDKKDYSPTKPQLSKMWLMGAVISLSFFAALVLFKLIWAFVSVNGVIEAAPAWIYSIIFWIYTIPYGGIMGLSHGNMTVYSQILMLVIPILASVTGYAAGLKGINITDKMASLVYEKKKDE